MLGQEIRQFRAIVRRVLARSVWFTILFLLIELKLLMLLAHSQIQQSKNFGTIYGVCRSLRRFGRRFCQNILPTCKNLYFKRVPVSATSQCYLNENKDIRHALLTCLFTFEVWAISQFHHIIRDFSTLCLGIMLHRIVSSSLSNCILFAYILWGSLLAGLHNA